MLENLKLKECLLMNNIKIYKMTKDDIQDALNLEKSHNIKILSKNLLENEIENKNAYYIVAKVNDNIVGYAGISYVLDSADLISIVVDKDKTNMSIATHMLNNIISFCKNNNIIEIMLEVRCSNIPAQKLYKKFGFKQISIRKKYYDNLEDAYIMKLNIKIA